MMAFDTVYYDVAANEARVLHVFDEPGLPMGTYVFRELYCEEPNCDCRRVILHVHLAEQRRVVASINYAFEPPKPPFADEPQIFLDPLNPQSELSDLLFDLFEAMIAQDLGYHERLVRHYTMWKAVVDDPSHPDHAKVRTEEHDDPSFRPAFPRQQPARREAPKVGPNEPCPCGSGKKYKKCCSLKGAAAGRADAGVGRNPVDQSNGPPRSGSAARPNGPAGRAAPYGPHAVPGAPASRAASPSSPRSAPSAPASRAAPPSGPHSVPGARSDHTAAPTGPTHVSSPLAAAQRGRSLGSAPLPPAPRQGRRERPLETGEERHQFVLNPYLDERLTSCPLCKAPTKVRKFALAVHVEPGTLVAQGLTCRYCPGDDLLIVHQDVLEAEMATALSEHAPEVVGNPYVVLGTFDRDLWRKGVRTGLPMADPMGALHPFRKQLTLHVEPGGWVRKTK